MKIILSALLRLSNNDGITDNFAQGGVAVGITVKKGFLRKIGQDKFGNRYLKHPLGIVLFENFRIPFWDETLKLGKDSAKIFQEIKLIGWDIAITNDGPYLLEAKRLSDFYLSQSQGDVFIIRFMCKKK